MGITRCCWSGRLKKTTGVEHERECKKKERKLSHWKELGRFPKVLMEGILKEHALNYVRRVNVDGEQ